MARGPARPSRDTPITTKAQDVVIPAHLLQAIGTAATPQDQGTSTDWRPRQASVRRTSVDGPWRNRLSGEASQWRRHQPRPVPLQRSSTVPSRPTSGDPNNPTQHGGFTQADEAEKQKSSRRRSNNGRRASWRLSYTPGYTESLELSRPGSPISPVPAAYSSRESALRNSKNIDSHSHLNPFETPAYELPQQSSNRSNTNPFATRSNSFANDKISVVDHAAQHDTGNHGRDTTTAAPEAIYVPEGGRPRKGTLTSIIDAVVPDALQRKMTNASSGGLGRHSSMRKVMDRAKTRGVELQRKKWVQVLFEYCIYLFLVLFTYFVLIGMPLWKGAVWWLYWVVANKFAFAGGWGITLGLALFYAFAPLLVLFEKNPPEAEITTETKIHPNVQDTALMIPCYKSANIIGATLEAALKIFPPSHIFVIANGNSPTPLDNTEEVCRPYGVNHVWSPIGSKIVAQFVGCYAMKSFKNVLLIDDDCCLPANFPVVTERLVGMVQCIGYTIKSVGPNHSKGNLCQQAQDLEYKLSGLQREFAGRVGSATFPHGAISLWNRDLLVKTFHEHPGFNVSEDWFFGHVARELGCRIKMCSSVFVETETPTAVFISSGGARGGFGEMTIFSQRFKRWNFFFVNGMWYNWAYIFTSWKLGWWEIGAKIFVFQEIYETLLYLLTPFVLPISFYVRPSFCGILLGATIVMYLINVIIFNEIHLRRKNERLGWQLLYVYYLPYKIVLTFVNVASCYWSLWKYARYFAHRHPKVTEDEKAVEVVVRLEEEQHATESGLARRVTVRNMGSKRSKTNPLEDRERAPKFNPTLEFTPASGAPSVIDLPISDAHGGETVHFSMPQFRKGDDDNSSGYYTNSSDDSSVKDWRRMKAPNEMV